MAQRKKEKDNSGILIGLGVGGGILALLIIAGAIAIFLSLNAAEPQKAPARDPLADFKPPPPPPKPKLNKENVDIGDKPRPTSGIRARADRPRRQNELRQIGLFYTQYRDTFNRPPPTVQDFTEYIKREAFEIKQAIDEKYYVLLPNVRDNGIVAYERDPDQGGRHGVVNPTGTFDEITTQELIDTVKGQGK
jgi:hypothetical protein